MAIFTVFLLICVCLARSAECAITFTTLFSFSGTNGIEPDGRLLQGPDGGLYGTARDTSYGNTSFGYYGRGVIFKITTNGSFRALAFFTNTVAAYPRGGLVLGNDGDLYGTTAGGGTNNEGTIYKVATNGMVTTLATLRAPNGTHPQTSLLNLESNTFIGTTIDGGPTSGGRLQTFGTIFSITTEGVLQTLVHFDGTNGTFPAGELIRGKDGFVYGVTEGGGSDWLRQHGLTYEFSCDCGTVFRMTPGGGVTTIAAFNGYNGHAPMAIAQSADGGWFGITESGGATNTAERSSEYQWTPFRGEGTIFKIEPNEKITTLVLFNGPNGKNPDTFISGRDGNFYGTTRGGGAHNFGTIFRITPSGKFDILYSFTRASGYSRPVATLMQGVDGNLYGTNSHRGANDCGSIFRLSLK